MKLKISPLTLQKARTLVSINGTSVVYQLKVLARRTARLSTRVTHTGSAKKVEGYAIC